MQNDGSDGSNGSSVPYGDHCIDISKLEEHGKIENLPQAKGGGGEQASLGECADKEDVQKVTTVVISNGESGTMVPVAQEVKGNVISSDLGSVVAEPKVNALKILNTKHDETVCAVTTTKKGFSSRSESFSEQCRVCQHHSEEALIDLGCQCRGELAKAHRSCIDTWFRTRGSNTCEICQQVATNVSPPELLQSRNYFIWRIDPALGPSIAPERERGCNSPLWVACSVLIGGLLLDVLISVSLGVSALPLNIIVGVLAILGLVIALRFALECFLERGLRRPIERVDRNIGLGPLGYHPAV